ncbi:MAG TPA: hypothetical protein DCL44_02675 [Elusimicrobia bacterium]|nr:hypothetical protein [Elusimicrobiota bacterium]
MKPKMFGQQKLFLLGALAFLPLFAGLIPAYASQSLSEKKLVPAQREDFLRRLEVNLKASRTLQAEFVQEKHLSIFQDVLVSSGSFAFAAPSRLRWEITEPFHSLLVMNGRELAKYDFFKGKPRRLKLPAADILYEVLNQIAGLHQGKFGEQAENYELEIYVGEAARLVLTPKSKKLRQFIPGIEMKFSDALNSVKSVMIREGDSDFTVIVFENVRLNPELPDSLFAAELK